MRRNIWYLVVTVGLIVGALVATVLSGNKPILGLDLQGGISQVLQPTSSHYNKDSLNKAVDIIRSRVNGLGVAEPEISRSGKNVIIDLPGVRDRAKANRLVGKTAELQFRPVLAQATPKLQTPTTTKPASPTTTVPGATTTTTTTPKPKITYDLTHPEAAIASKPATLPFRDSKTPPLSLGPATMVGKGNVKSAAAELDPQGTGGWQVVLKLTDQGHKKFNQLAAASYGKTAPQNEVAIVLDGVIQSSPAFQTNNFAGDVSISGSFSQSDAKDLATVLNYGALPVQFKALTTESVSPTLGKDQLAAGIAAGLIGLALVAIYMVVFYRILGLVVILGLSLSAAAIYSIISFMGTLSTPLTLTLAGVTGLIVSVGITVDSYVVYFERLKDEVRAGRTVRSSVDRGFVRSFRTIVAADVVSLIGAVVLYALAVGSVRQFALLLGISTALDLALSYFFMHPLVVILSRKRELVTVPVVGIGAGLDARGVEA